MLFLCFVVNNQFMKKIFIFLLFVIIVLSTIGICSNFSKSTSFTNADYLRIHIRANSNETIDQDVKFEIKDELVKFLTPKLAVCKTKLQVVDMIKEQTISLEDLANRVLKQKGFDYVSKVKIDSENFPTRSYDGYTLESGIYDAVIVELGKAEGNNWWCVIYPPICFVNYNANSSSEIVYKSKILEIIKQFFS